jgi:hypothetical protein
MSRTAQISKEKMQTIITLRHEGQLIRNISRTSSAVYSSAVSKTIKRYDILFLKLTYTRNNTCIYDETGSHEDCNRNGRPRVTSAAEDKFIIDTNLRNCSPNK